MMMGFPIFLMVVFFVGINGDPMQQCLEMMKFEEQAETFTQLANEEQVNVMCTNVTGFFNCMDDAIRDKTGFTLRELEVLLKGTEMGTAFTLLVNVIDLVDDLCTEGSQLHADYMENIECYQQVDLNILNECKEQAKVAYDLFMNLEQGMSRGDPLKSCADVAYQFGCLGAAVHEKCGDKGFKTFKDIFKKLGFFKSGLCPSDVMETLKTSFVSSLELPEYEKSFYRVVLNLKKRRK